MKRKIIALVIVIATLAGIFTTAAFSEGEDPELNIAACTLSLNDSIYIKYAVTGNAELSNVKLLVWTSPKTEYTYGTQNYTLDPSGTTTVSGKSAKVFQYTKLAAKQMGDYVYARAYAENGNASYYSPVKKYSIMQYIYNKLGKTGTASTDQKLINLLNEMLEYGKNAQINFGYKTDRLVTFDYYQIKVVGGTLSDMCDNGLYLPGDNVTLIAPKTNESGEEFSYWQNGYGTVTGTTQTVNVTVGNENAVYTAVYGSSVPETPGTEDYCQIVVVGGTLADGTTEGMFLPGDTITLVAPDTNGDGQNFSLWKDETGVVPGTTATMTVTVGNENKTYTAVYGVNVDENGRYIESVELDGTELVVYYSDGTTENVDASGIIGESSKSGKFKGQMIHVGDIIKFGKYEQDNDLSNDYEDIDWIVVDIQDGKALLWSKYAIDVGATNGSYDNLSSSQHQLLIDSSYGNITNLLLSSFDENDQQRLAEIPFLKNGPVGIQYEWANASTGLTLQQFPIGLCSKIECSATPYATSKFDNLSRRVGSNYGVNGYFSNHVTAGGTAYYVFINFDGKTIYETGNLSRFFYIRPAIGIQLD